MTLPRVAAIALALLAPLALAACGIKGPLEPPPSSRVVDPEEPPSNLAVRPEERDTARAAANAPAANRPNPALDWLIR